MRDKNMRSYNCRTKCFKHWHEVILCKTGKTREIAIQSMFKLMICLHQGNDTQIHAEVTEIILLP